VWFSDIRAMEKPIMSLQRLTAQAMHKTKGRVLLYFKRGNMPGMPAGFIQE
jgi:hypothetical protein